MPAATSQPATLPFTVIGGFLGAGKTTLLRHWLLHAPPGRRVAVLVNDFGALNLDAALVAGVSGQTVALSNGCVCCSIGDDLGAALLQVLAGPHPVDAVVVEASGVGDPGRIGQYALAEPRLHLAGVLVLVDAAALQAQAADPLLADSLARPLPEADLVLLNQADRCDAATLAAAQAWVHTQAPGVPTLVTVQAAVDPAPWLADGLHAPAPVPAAPTDHSAGLDDPPRDQHHAPSRAPTAAQAAQRWAGRALGADTRHSQQFTQWSAQPAEPLDEPALRAWLQGLARGDTPAGSALRAKGLLRSRQRGWVMAQLAGRHVRLQAAAPAALQALARPGHSAPDHGSLVVIGLRRQLQPQALAAGLSACGAPPEQQQA